MKSTVVGYEKFWNTTYRQTRFGVRVSATADFDLKLSCGHTVTRSRLSKSVTCKACDE